ncbi:RNA-guided endonuclease InsQ/TnpB family protein [Streptomyces sp. NPDC057257]|uniref:RNA-guided endonuclease InsQ/TnpB family protein n=1 Tax=Streptomyces sp. NPDC057257 TaxID=3346071 RepID=UPI00363C8CEE
MPHSVKRAFKYRFYPNDVQAAELTRTFGCVRVVYNLALQARTTAWYTERRRINYVQTSALLTEWKRTEEYAYLTDVSSVPLQQALRHLQGAFVNFFEKRCGYPRFKSRKRSRDSAEYTRSAFTYRDGRLTLAKMREPLDIVWSRPLPEGQTPSTVTVSQDSAGRWFVSMLCEDASVRALPNTASTVGIDAGITALVTLSTGEKVSNPKFEKKDRAKLARARHELSRKEKGSRNRDKARIRVARIHARIADRRRDFLHKLSTHLVRENQTIVIEDLAVRSMLKNRRLSRAISDASWAELRSMLEYKAEWHGRELIAIDRWYPSSRTCSACGHLVAKLPLSIREWTCAACGTTHDRDENAAKNVLAAGLAVSACGAGVRPQRRSSGRAAGAEAGKPRRSAGQRRRVEASPSSEREEAN